jgi:hypothetical protein
MSRLLIDAAKLQELWDLAGPTRELLRDVLAISGGLDFRVSSIYRTFAEDSKLSGSGVHADGPPYRAVDLVVEGWGWTQYADLAARVNARWTYDPARPTKQVALGSQHGTAPHLHLQVMIGSTRRAFA